MFSFLRSSLASRLDDPVDAVDHESEKKTAVVEEKRDAGPDSDLASDVNPGELSFEEGMSQWKRTFSRQPYLMCVDTRHRWRNWSPFGCI
jgi:hypothetical protein